MDELIDLDLGIGAPVARLEARLGVEHLLSSSRRWTWHAAVVSRQVVSRAGRGRETLLRKGF